MKPLPFLENVVILTGASCGIGRELALQLAHQGAWLSLAARDVRQLEQVARLCRQRGGRALVVPTDVTEQTQCRTLIERTVAEYGRIDTLINNAGTSMWARFDELRDLDPLEQIMRVNYFGSVYCTYYALPFLKETRGRIIAISSLAGRAGVPTRSGYAASKHAMVGFFDSLRIELAHHGVTVSIIYPDFVTTEIRRRAFGPDGRALDVDPIPKTRAMDPESCARRILPAIARRKRQQLMTFRGRLGQWLKLVAPGLVDRMARSAVRDS